MDVFGLNVIKQDRHRDLIVSPEQTPSGNVRLRIGREHGEGWEQHAYVVLDSDEAIELGRRLLNEGMNSRATRLETLGD